MQGTPPLHRQIDAELEERPAAYQQCNAKTVAAT